MAPATMVFHTRFVAATLAGAPVGWLPQPRDDRGLTWGEAFAANRDQTILGAVLAAGIGGVAPEYLLWFAPVMIGLLFAAPIAVLTSRGSAGRLLRRAGLFVTPEETAPPMPLRLAGAAMRRPPAPLPDRAALPGFALPALPALAPLDMVALPFDARPPRAVLPADATAEAARRNAATGATPSPRSRRA